MKRHRDNRGRYAKKYRKASRWEMIIVLSIVASYIVAIGLHELGMAVERWIDTVYASTEEEVIDEVVEPKVVQIAVKIDWTPERIKEEVWKRAEKYNTFPEMMWQTILCENPQLDPELQSLIVKDGVREDSWGLSQFHLPSGNKTAEGVTITKEMAQNPEIALDAMAYHFSIGNAELWTCFRNIYR